MFLLKILMAITAILMLFSLTPVILFITLARGLIEVPIEILAVLMDCVDNKYDCWKYNNCRRHCSKY